VVFGTAIGAYKEQTGFKVNIVLVCEIRSWKEGKAREATVDQEGTLEFLKCSKESMLGS